jgi:hypothetical protein
MDSNKKGDVAHGLGTTLAIGLSGFCFGTYYLSKNKAVNLQDQNIEKQYLIDKRKNFLLITFGFIPLITILLFYVFKYSLIMPSAPENGHIFDWFYFATVLSSIIVLTILINIIPPCPPCPYSYNTPYPYNAPPPK